MKRAPAQKRKIFPIGISQVPSAGDQHGSAEGQDGRARTIVYDALEGSSGGPGPSPSPCSRERRQIRPMSRFAPAGRGARIGPLEYRLRAVPSPSWLWLCPRRRNTLVSALPTSSRRRHTRCGVQRRRHSRGRANRLSPLRCNRPFVTFTHRRGGQASRERKEA